MDKSINRAKEIISHHIQNILSGQKENVLSIILVGSLSNNSYTGNPGSDIDLIHILKDDAVPDSRRSIHNLIEKTQLETGNDLPISKCIYRYSDLFRPYRLDFELSVDNKDYLELPIEVFRIKDSGIVIYGDNIIDKIDTPTRDDVVTFNLLTEKWDKQIARENPEIEKNRQQIMKDPPVRLIAQIVITRAMLDYYFATEKSCSSKLDIASRMINEVKDYRFQDLLDLSVEWRYHQETWNRDKDALMKSMYQEWYSFNN